MTTFTDMVYTLGGVPVLGPTTGNVFILNNAATNTADTATNGKTLALPFATLDYAVNACTASNGDVILVAASHHESLTASLTAEIDKIGVSVIGMGRGMNRPIFDTDATAGKITISAASVRLSNVIVRASTPSTVVGVAVAGADCEIDNCLFTWEATGDEFISTITVTSAARCHIHDNVFDTEEGAGAATEAITLVAADDLILRRNIFRGTWTGSVLFGKTTLSARVVVADNVIYNSDNTAYNAIDFGTVSTTGIVAGNYITTLYSGAGTMAKLIRIADTTWHNNTFANDVSEHAVGNKDTTLIPATSST